MFEGGRSERPVQQIPVRGLVRDVMIGWEHPHDRVRVFAKQQCRGETDRRAGIPLHWFGDDVRGLDFRKLTKDTGAQALRSQHPNAVGRE